LSKLLVRLNSIDKRTGISDLLGLITGFVVGKGLVTWLTNSPTFIISFISVVAIIGVVVRLKRGKQSLETMSLGAFYATAWLVGLAIIAVLGIWLQVVLEVANWATIAYLLFLIGFYGYVTRWKHRVRSALFKDNDTSIKDAGFKAAGRDWAGALKLPLVLLALFYAGVVAILLFATIAGLFVLGSVVGIPILQLVTGGISAASAAASATAAVLIWRGNVQNRKTVLTDRVLGPAFAEIRLTRERLESWKADAIDIALSTQFLNNIASDWMYYILDPNLRARLEDFQRKARALGPAKDLAKTDCGNIIMEAASEAFQLQDVNSVFLWTSRSWDEDQPTGETGRAPAWELAMDLDPLRTTRGYHIHTMQILDRSEQSFSVPLLSKDKVPLSTASFHAFWELAKKKAAANGEITSFRESYTWARELAIELEQTLDSEIKRLR